jgi:hypothetical protein
MDYKVLFLAVRFNEQGIRCLDTERYKDATVAFARALKLAKQPQEDETEPPNQQAVTRTEPFSHQHLLLQSHDEVCTEEVKPLTACHIPSKVGEEPQSSSDEYHHVYTLPCPATADMFCPEERNSHYRLCVAIMYNFALACQLTAMHDESSRERLNDAIQLYELAHTLQLKTEIQMGVQFTLGIINNLGQAHRCLGAGVKADECFRHLLSCILFLKEHGDKRTQLYETAFFPSFGYLIVKKSSAAAA